MQLFGKSSGVGLSFSSRPSIAKCPYSQTCTEAAGMPPIGNRRTRQVHDVCISRQLVLVDNTIDAYRLVMKYSVLNAKVSNVLIRREAASLHVNHDSVSDLEEYEHTAPQCVTSHDSPSTACPSTCLPMPRLTDGTGHSERVSRQWDVERRGSRSQELLQKHY